MTSSERKIINCLWETKEKTHIRLVAQKANLSSDYARLLCRSLARSGHIKFENDLAHLLKKGRSRFENNNPVADEPVAVAANVTLLTPRPTSVGRDPGPSGLGTDEPASSDEELDKAISDLEPSSQKEEGEKIDEPEEPEKTESAEEAEGKEEQREEEILAEPAIEEEKTEAPGATTEPKEEVKTEAQETGATETKPADNPAPTASLESPEETAAMKKEEKQEKEDVAKPSGSSGWSFKKIVNWFTEKK